MMLCQLGTAPKFGHSIPFLHSYMMGAQLRMQQPPCGCILLNYHGKLDIIQWRWVSVKFPYIANIRQHTRMRSTLTVMLGITR